MTPIDALENLHNIALEVPGQSYESGELYKTVKRALLEKQLLEEAAKQANELLMDATNFRECHEAFVPLQKIIVMLRSPTA